MYYIFSKKKPNNFVFPNISQIFSLFVWYSLVFLVLITKIPNFGMKIEYCKKKSNFFLDFFTENVVHLGIFGISGIPKISVIPFNTIEY